MKCFSCHFPNSPQYFSSISSMQIFSVSLEVFDDGGKIGEWRSSERDENVVDIGSVWCVLLWNVGWQRVSVQSYIYKTGPRIL